MFIGESGGRNSCSGRLEGLRAGRGTCGRWRATRIKQSAAKQVVLGSLWSSEATMRMLYDVLTVRRRGA